MNGMQNYVIQQLNKQKRTATSSRPSSDNNTVKTAATGVDVAIQLHGSTVFSHHFDLNETTASKLINN
jgi:hypothetical protein